MVARGRHDHRDALRWMAPHPLWLSGAPGQNGAPGRPAILRFETEDFMDELIALTATRPEALPAWLAVPETWRAPAPKPPVEGLAIAQPLSQARDRATRLARRRGLVGGVATKPVAAASGDLKLYQPAQDRFYLVAAQLVCVRPGLPDRRITAAREERARFVLRRIAPPAGTGGDFDPEGPGTTEYAFVPRSEGGYWRPLASLERNQLLPDEERLGLFPSTHQVDGQKRRLMLGALPVARRETYAGAPLGTTGAAPPPPADPDGPSPLSLLWQTEVTTPWAVLDDQAAVLRRVIFGDPQVPDLGPSAADLAATATDLLRDYRARMVTVGWFILADTRRFLREHLPVLWADLTGAAMPRPLTSGEQALKDTMAAFTADEELVTDIGETHPAYEGRVFGNFIEALTEMTDTQAAQIERADTVFDWPPGLSETLTDGWPDFVWIAAHPGLAIDGAVLNRPSWRAPAAGAIDTLAERIEAALPATPTGPVPDLAAPPAADRGAEPWFTIRCVFERPNCAGFAAPVVSAPSAPFRMASFFDPDAPARDIRIPMPVDISPAGLRKFRKGAGFVVSDMFCGQFERFKAFTFGDLIRSMLPWPLHKDLPGGAAAPCGKGSGNAFGLMISLSIPIVTICAFFLMLIMVTLFDIVFRWLPYLLTVIRIPLSKGTKEP